MARPRKFSEDAALEGAMQIFWRQGYLATNLPDLLTAMGLTRGSFYAGFGDKIRVYLRALDHYDRTVVSGTVAMLDACDGPTASACLSKMFTGGGDPQKGCFICNAMVEMGPANEEAAARTSAMAGRLRGAIAGVIRRHDPAKDDRTVARLADVVLHLYFGHQAVGKADTPSQDWPVRLAHLLSETDPA